MNFLDIISLAPKITPLMGEIEKGIATAERIEADPAVKAAVATFQKYLADPDVKAALATAAKVATILDSQQKSAGPVAQTTQLGASA